MTPACCAPSQRSQSSPPNAAPDAAPDAALDAALDDCDTLGYRECREVARSADAVVIAGIDASDRSVAVKMFSGGEALASDQEFWDRVQEYSAVPHPNLVEAHDFDSARSLIVTELLAGDWGQAIMSGPLPVSAVAAIARQALEGLKRLHKKGLIHGRISPRTLLHDESKATTKLAFPDWYRGGASFPLPDVTDRHVAPEILDPTEFGTPNAALDLYCLGTTLVELLMGPEYDLYCDSIHGGASARDLARAWQSWHANPATAFPPLTQMRRDVPAEFAAVIDRLVAKRTIDRFASAAEALEEFPEACETKTGGLVGGPASPPAISKGSKPLGPKKRADKNGATRRAVLFAVPLVVGVLCFALLTASEEDDDPRADSSTGRASMTITSDASPALLRDFSLFVENRNAKTLQDLKVFMRGGGQASDELKNSSSDKTIYCFKVPGDKSKAVELAFEGRPDTYKCWIESDFYDDDNTKSDFFELKAAKEYSQKTEDSNSPVRKLKQKLFDLNMTVDFIGKKQNGNEDVKSGLTIKLDDRELPKPKHTSKSSDSKTTFKLGKCVKIGERKITVEYPDYEPWTKTFEVVASEPGAIFLAIELVPNNHKVDLKLEGIEISSLPPGSRVKISRADVGNPMPEEEVPLEVALEQGLELKSGSYEFEIVGLGEDFACPPVRHDVKAGDKNSCNLKIASTKRRLTLIVEPSDADVRVLDWEPKGGGADIRLVGAENRHEFVVAKGLKKVTLEVSHPKGEYKTQKCDVHLGGSSDTNDPIERMVQLDRLPSHQTTFTNLTRSKVWNIKLENRVTKKVIEFRLEDRLVKRLIEGVYVLEGVSESNQVLEQEITIDRIGTVNIHTPAK